MKDQMRRHRYKAIKLERRARAKMLRYRPPRPPWTWRLLDSLAILLGVGRR